jgi:hypothetical protein
MPDAFSSPPCPTCGSELTLQYISQQRGAESINVFFCCACYGRFVVTSRPPQSGQADKLAELETTIAAWQQDRALWLNEYGLAHPYPHAEAIADLEHALETLREKVEA